MGFAVFHIEKITTGASSLGAHIDRSPGQEYTYKNADPEKLQENVHLTCGKFNTMKLNEAIDLRIKTAYTGTKAIRKDAVKGMSIVLTGSHDQMKNIFSNENSRNAWLNENIKFIKEEFGGENVVRFTLHMDEKTPHVHAVVVPLTKDGRLSAKEVMGDKTAMSERQTRYADKMKPFGLERGIIGSKAVHNSEGWYLGQQKKEQEAVLSQIPPLTFLDRISPTNYINKLTEGLKLAAKQKKDAEMIAHSRTENLKVVNGLIEINKKVAEKDLQKVKGDLALSEFRFKTMAKVVFNKALSPEEESYFSALKEGLEKVSQENQIRNDLSSNQNQGFKR
ncbi:MobV family relaxase [Pedobacter sp.]|uniref:MobV family relaxase n=1 Tax=Pedobacter sp. TaxID=1411316 RepID=UPI003D7F8B45